MQRFQIQVQGILPQPAPIALTDRRDKLVWKLFCSNNDPSQCKPPVGSKIGVQFKAPYGQVKALALTLNTTPQALCIRLTALLRQYHEIPPEQPTVSGIAATEGPPPPAQATVECSTKAGTSDEAITVCSFLEATSQAKALNNNTTSCASTATGGPSRLALSNDSEKQNGEQKGEQYGTVAGFSVQEDAVLWGAFAEHNEAVATFGVTLNFLANKLSKSVDSLACRIEQLTGQSLTSAHPVTSTAAPPRLGSAEAKKKARVPPGRSAPFAEEEDDVLWDAYVAQNGPTLPPPRRCTVRWTPPQSFLTTLADQLGRSPDEIVKRMNNLFKQYQWSLGRFRPPAEPEPCVAAEMRDRVNCLLGCDSSLCLSVGDVSVPDLNTLHNCETAHDAHIHTEQMVPATPVNTPLEDAAAALTALGVPMVAVTTDPAPTSQPSAIQSTLLLRRSARKRRAATVAPPTLYLREAGDGGSSCCSAPHVPRKRARTYSSEQDKVIWDAHQEYLKQKALGARDNQKGCLEQIASQLGRKLESVRYRLSVLKKCNNDGGKASPGEEPTHQLETASPLVQQPVHNVDSADALDQFVTYEQQPRTVTITPISLSALACLEQELNAPPGNTMAGMQRQADCEDTIYTPTAAEQGVEEASNGEVSELSSASSAGVDGAGAATTAAAALLCAEGQDERAVEECDNYDWYATALRMPNQTTPFQAQDDAVLVRHVVSALACRNWVAGADGSLEGLLRSPQVLADRARELFGQAIDVVTSSLVDGPADQQYPMGESSARGM
jgi:hypothetical protein